MVGCEVKVCHAKTEPHESAHEPRRASESCMDPDVSRDRIEGGWTPGCLPSRKPQGRGHLWCSEGHRWPPRCTENRVRRMVYPDPVGAVQVSPRLSPGAHRQGTLPAGPPGVDAHDVEVPVEPSVREAIVDEHEARAPSGGFQGTRHPVGSRDHGDAPPTQQLQLVAEVVQRGDPGEPQPDCRA